MAILGDFVVVLSSEVRIGDPGGGVKKYWNSEFRTSNRSKAGKAVMMFEHRDVTYTGNKVFLNGKHIFTLAKSDADRYRADIAIFNASNLRDDSKNELEIRAKKLDIRDTNKYDDFFIKNIVIFFHQES